MELYARYSCPHCHTEMVWDEDTDKYYPIIMKCDECGRDYVLYIEMSVVAYTRKRGDENGK